MPPCRHVTLLARQAGGVLRTVPREQEKTHSAPSPDTASTLHTPFSHLFTKTPSRGQSRNLRGGKKKPSWRRAKVNPLQQPVASVDGATSNRYCYLLLGGVQPDTGTGAKWAKGAGTRGYWHAPTPYGVRPRTSRGLHQLQTHSAGGPTSALTRTQQHTAPAMTAAIAFRPGQNLSYALHECHPPTQRRALRDSWT